ncbi:MAG: COX15/CtaA family protein, partial [Alphaproteobacteria bacterium]|nr:COX15/CtaA family protein [Alphaproteobacteria bacterium]
ALVAGLHAGLIYNEFPLMGGRFLPEDYWQVNLPLSPVNFLMNASQNPAAAQFHHRILAESLAVLAVIWAHLLYRQAASPTIKRAALYVMGTVVVQMTLGISTLLFSVPVLLGVMHQAGALALFTAIFYAATRRRGQFV